MDWGTPRMSLMQAFLPFFTQISKVLAHGGHQLDGDRLDRPRAARLGVRARRAAAHLPRRPRPRVPLQEGLRVQAAGRRGSILIFLKQRHVKAGNDGWFQHVAFCIKSREIFGSPIIGEIHVANYND